MASGSLYSIPQDEITHYLLYEMRVLTHMSQEACFLIEVASLCSRACSSAYLVYKPTFSRRPTPDLSTRNLFSTMALSKPFFWLYITLAPCPCSFSQLCSTEGCTSECPHGNHLGTVSYVCWPLSRSIIKNDMLQLLNEVNYMNQNGSHYVPYDSCTSLFLTILDKLGLFERTRPTFLFLHSSISLLQQARLSTPEQ